MPSAGALGSDGGTGGSVSSPVTSRALDLLVEAGCVPYLDRLDRTLIRSGALRRLISEDHVAGVTTNPIIFGKAIADGHEYDEDLVRMASAGIRGDELFLELMIDDVRAAADELADIHEGSDRAFGYVSLEVLPELAHDSEATIAMGRALWERVKRRNLMIKVPATPAGIVAIEELIAGGVNVNVTTIFSPRVYEDVFWAFVRGQQRRRVPDVTSVASYFVSRIDGLVDELIEERVEQGILDAAWLERRGQAALACARAVHQRHAALHRRPEIEAILRDGGRPQRLVWASMAPRNPAYRDVLYLEGVALPGTIATMPLATLEAFRDHGVVEPQRVTDAVQAQRMLDDLAAAGISMDDVADRLLEAVLGLFGQAIVDLREVVSARLRGAAAL
jgi:transaldolase